MKRTAAGRLSSSHRRAAGPLQTWMPGWRRDTTPTPLSGGDRKALNKELGKARAMTNILAAQSAEMRAKAETMLQQADRLLCESWNERMWADGDPHARERALAVASQDPSSGVTPDEAVAEVRDVLASINDTCPDSPKNRRAAYRAYTVGSDGHLNR
jgi:hypothetical protein